jgi:hypothetical protein
VSSPCGAVHDAAIRRRRMVNSAQVMPVVLRTRVTRIGMAVLPMVVKKGSILRPDFGGLSPLVLPGTDHGQPAIPNETPSAEWSWGFSLGWKQFDKQAEKQLRVCLGASAPQKYTDKEVI